MNLTVCEKLTFTQNSSIPMPAKNQLANSQQIPQSDTAVLWIIWNYFVFEKKKKKLITIILIFKSSPHSLFWKVHISLSFNSIKKLFCFEFYLLSSFSTATGWGILLKISSNIFFRSQHNEVYLCLGLYKVLCYDSKQDWVSLFIFW